MQTECFEYFHNSYLHWHKITTNWCIGKYIFPLIRLILLATLIICTSTRFTWGENEFRHLHITKSICQKTNKQKTKQKTENNNENRIHVLMKWSENHQTYFQLKILLVNYDFGKWHPTFVQHFTCKNTWLAHSLLSIHRFFSDVFIEIK